MAEITSNKSTLSERFIGGLHKALIIIQSILLGSLLIIVTLQIFNRILPIFGNLLWTEEISRFLLIWVIFLGAAIGVREGTHFTVSILSDAKSAVLTKIWDIGIILLMLVFAIVFTFRGIKYAKVLLWDISDIAQISMLWVGIAIPIFGILSLIFLIDQLYKCFRKVDK